MTCRSESRSRTHEVRSFTWGALSPPKTQQVTLMPQEGETFAGALDSLEARCRSETRLLYESEGKEDLLGEEGVPESLKAWLEESRERAMSNGGHRQEARRRLRGQVGVKHTHAYRTGGRRVTCATTGGVAYHSPTEIQGPLCLRNKV